MSPNGIKGATLVAFAMSVLWNWAQEHGGVVVSSQGGFTLGDTSVRWPMPLGFLRLDGMG
jgi:hypothetical protein